MRLSLDASHHQQQHIISALGCNIYSNLDIIFGGTYARERADAFNSHAYLQGSGAFTRLNWHATPNRMGLRNAFVDATYHKARNTFLDETSQGFKSVNAVTFPDYTRTTTTTGQIITRRDFIGGQSWRFAAGLGFDIANNGILELAAQHQRINAQSQTDGSIHYTQYLPQQRAKFNIGANTDGRIDLGIEKGLSEHWALQLSGHKYTRHERDYAAYLGVNYRFGNHDYTRPAATRANLIDTLNNITSTSPYAINNLDQLGTVKTTQSITQQQTTVDTQHDTTAPSATSSTHLGTTDIGQTLSGNITFSEPITTASLGALPAGMSATVTPSGSSLSVSVSTNAAFTAFGTVSIPITISDAAGNTSTVNISVTVNDVLPIAAGAFAGLGDMTVSDASGNFLLAINAGGVTDPLGRSITYSATGLPPREIPWSDMQINQATGVISGVHDSLGNESFNVTIIASNGHSSISKTFVLTIQNDG